ncbi:hypothetical protein IE81DRAFT_222867 [Ceraceosorus guamensis]|uniref:Zn(2)-C6 fungal-type domain-containing protein n=1 Tax=Ceraceosorus guamensis TaxID=1522189 RepID=A0A316VS97_9BASI|nr:hypothetical protein IE81DRAFT_222867 [Ceraceosorus guamensis]PWN40382.1 hypothetical protein IE81DRAFT_222867 [Ceraceosorus guamensis]
MNRKRRAPHDEQDEETSPTFGAVLRSGQLRVSDKPSDRPNVGTGEGDPDVHRASCRSAQAHADPPAAHKTSCLACRESKVRCVPRAGQVLGVGKCMRCERLKKDCIFKEHRRGRKPGKVKHVQIDRRWQALIKLLDELESLTDAIADLDGAALVRSLRYQLVSSLAAMEKDGTKAHQGLGHDHSPSGASSPTEPAFSMASTSINARRGGDDAGQSSSTALPPTATLLQPQPRSVESHGTPANAAQGLSPYEHSISHNYPYPLPQHASRSRGRGSAAALVELEDYEAQRSVPRSVDTLTNPLKLLARASAVVRSASGTLDEDEEVEDQRELSASLLEEDARDRDVSGAHGDARSRDSRALRAMHRAAENRIHDLSPGSKTTVTPRRSIHASAGQRKETVDDVNWSSYFARGIFAPLYDTGPDLDPIELGIITVDLGQALVAHFYSAHSSFVHVFDPLLSTLEYMRRRSCFLLTVICQISAITYGDDSGQRLDGQGGVLQRLVEHREYLTPIILCGGYRSVEAAQACIVLAQYAPLASSATEDQTWSLMGTALRMTTEVGCNLKLFSYLPVPLRLRQESGARAEKHQRQLRNTERLWFTLWLFASHVSSQTGQRLMLSDEGSVAASGTWHTRDFALPQDEWLIAQVELRRIITRATERFHSQMKHLIAEASSTTSLNSSSALDYQAEAFRSSILQDLSRWASAWLGTPEAVPSQESQSRPLLDLGHLALAHAKLVTLSLPLLTWPASPRASTESGPKTLRLPRALLPHYRDACEAAQTFLSLLVSRWASLKRKDNVMLVDALHASVLAMRFASLAPCDEQPYVTQRDQERVAGMVQELCHLLQAEERRVGRRYANLLQSVLNTWKRTICSVLSEDLAPHMEVAPGQTPRHLEAMSSASGSRIDTLYSGLAAAGPQHSSSSGQSTTYNLDGNPDASALENGASLFDAQSIWSILFPEAVDGSNLDPFLLSLADANASLADMSSNLP